MLRKSDNMKEFYNHNILIKYDDYIMEDLKRYDDDIMVLSNVLSQLDCSIFGDSFCLSNYEMGFSIYNAYSDVVYIFSHNDLETLRNGRTVKLYAHEVDNDTRHELSRENLSYDIALQCYNHKGHKLSVYFEPMENVGTMIEDRYFVVNEKTKKTFTTRPGGGAEHDLIHLIDFSKPIIFENEEIKKYIFDYIESKATDNF